MGVALACCLGRLGRLGRLLRCSCLLFGSRVGGKRSSSQRLRSAPDRRRDARSPRPCCAPRRRDGIPDVGPADRGARVQWICRCAQVWTESGRGGYQPEIECEIECWARIHLPNDRRPGRGRTAALVESHRPRHTTAAYTRADVDATPNASAAAAISTAASAAIAIAGAHILGPRHTEAGTAAAAPAAAAAAAAPAAPAAPAAAAAAAAGQQRRSSPKQHQHQHQHQHQQQWRQLQRWRQQQRDEWCDELSQQQGGSFGCGDERDSHESNSASPMAEHTDPSRLSSISPENPHTHLQRLSYLEPDGDLEPDSDLEPDGAPQSGGIEPPRKAVRRRTHAAVLLGAVRDAC